MPPSNGTTGSAVPCVSITATGRDGLHGTYAPSVPATGATAANRSARSHANRLAMNAPADMPGGVHATGVNAEIGYQFADQSCDEAHVVDSLPVGYRRTAAIGPAEINAVGVSDDESVRVGDGIEVR